MAGFNYSIDPETGDYAIGPDGQFVADYTARTPMILVLLDERGRFWGDITLGSDIAEQFRGPPPADPEGALVDATTRALVPLQELGRLASFVVTVETVQDVPVIRVEAIDGGSGLPVQLTVQPIAGA